MKKTVLGLVLLSMLCVIIGCGSKMKDPKSVAQMSIDSIMNEDYQLFLKIRSPRVASMDNEMAAILHEEDPARRRFDLLVKAKHCTRWPTAVSGIEEVEYKTIKIEIKDNPEPKIAKDGMKYITFTTIKTFEILNHTPDPNYPKLKLPQFGEAKGWMEVEQQSDGKWTVSVPPDPTPYGLTKLLENWLRDAGY